jgi:hypothetical protein
MTAVCENVDERKRGLGKVLRRGNFLLEKFCGIFCYFLHKKKFKLNLSNPEILLKFFTE